MPEPSSPELVVVIPVFNEEECISSVVDQWYAQLSTAVSADFVLLTVNDGSRDKSLAILQEKAAQNPRIVVVDKENGGHGSAVRRGYEEALMLNPSWIFQVDSDDQFYAEDFSVLWGKREEADFLLGVRAKRNDPPARLVITRILRFFNLILFGTWVQDANSPFRLMRADFLKRALSVIPPHVFAPNIFISLFSTRKGFSSLSLPVRHKERETGVVSILRWKLLRVCGLTALELILFRLSLNSPNSREICTVGS